MESSRAERAKDALTLISQFALGSGIVASSLRALLDRAPDVIARSVVPQETDRTDESARGCWR